MAKMTLPIANGFYLSDSLPLSAQECLNAYPKAVQVQALAQNALFGTPGIPQIATTGSTEADKNRGSHNLGEKPYYVNNGFLWRVNLLDGVFSVENLGEIEGTGRVSMADNGTQLMILVPDGKGYIFTESPDSLQEIVDTDFYEANGAPQYLTYVDGFFVCTTDAKKFIISANNNGLSWNALDSGTAESNPDRVVAPVVYNNQLFIAGTEGIEAFNNIGGADFPFQRSGLFLDKGVYAPFSFVKAPNTFVFVGGGVDESPAIWRFAGNGLEKISTTAIEVILQRLTEDEVADIFAMVYAQNGAYFVMFSLPSTVLVFETLTGLWHERKSQIEIDGITQLIPCRVSSILTAYGKVLVGDSQDGRIGELDIDVYTEYGNNIVRRFSTMPFQNNMNAIFVASAELTMESGVGNDACPDPIVRMDTSKDGKRYSLEKRRAMGKLGEFNKRQIWRRLGRAARFDIFRFIMTDAVKFVAIQLTVDVQGADNA